MQRVTGPLVATSVLALCLTIHSLPAGAQGTGACGNSIPEAGEQCDDGNTADGDCCSATCQFETSGSPCADDGNPCTTDTCNGSGACTHPAAPNGTPCNDANACTNPDVCTGGACTGGASVVCPLCQTCDTGGGCINAPRTGCKLPVASARASLLLKDQTPDTNDQVAWKWKLGAATTFGELGDPLIKHDYALCLYAGVGAPLVFRATAPASGTCGTRPCWKQAGITGYTYIDKFTDPEGVLKLKVRSGHAGKAKASVKAKGTNLTGRPFGLPAPPLALPVRAQLQAESGLCLEADFVQPSSNAPGLFKSKSN